jgi:Ca2+-binding EF-hand superfamily protein
MPFAAGRAGSAKRKKAKAAKKASPRRVATNAQRVVTKQAINVWLEKFDADGNGQLGRGELKACMESISGSQVSEEDVDSTFKHADRSHTGELTPFEVNIAVATWQSALREKKFIKDAFDK